MISRTGKSARLAREEPAPRQATAPPARAGPVMYLDRREACLPELVGLEGRGIRRGHDHGDGGRDGVRLRIDVAGEQRRQAHGQTEDHLGTQAHEQFHGRALLSSTLTWKLLDAALRARLTAPGSR
jgi:hypothetical protein